MPRCEMCGAEKESLTTAKVSQAELDVCDSCSSFGSETTSQSETTSTSTDKTTPAETNETSSTEEDSVSRQTSQSSTTSETRTTESLDDSANPLAPGYGDILRDGRKEAGLNVNELADELNEKESLLRKIESEDKQPTTSLQEKIENHLGISLSMDDADSKDDREGDNSSTLNTTIGDKLDFDGL